MRNHTIDTVSRRNDRDHRGLSPRFACAAPFFHAPTSDPIIDRDEVPRRVTSSTRPLVTALGRRPARDPHARPFGRVRRQA
jgi:hypothetical protein